MIERVAPMSPEAQGVTPEGGPPPRAAGNLLLCPLQRVMSTAGDAGGRTP